MIKHSISNLDESGNVGTLDIINESSIILSIFHTLFMDTLHDLLKFLINFVSGPVESLRVLRHFKSRSGDTSGVAGLTWGEKDLVLMEDLDSLWFTWHVGTFNNNLDSSLDELHGVHFIDFVLSSTWNGYITFLNDFPRSELIVVLGIWVLLDVFRDSASLDVFQVKNKLKLLVINAILVIDNTIRIGQSYDLAAEVVNLLTGILGNVTRSRNGNKLALELLVLGLHHFHSEVHSAVSGGLWSD